MSTLATLLSEIEAFCKEATNSDGEPLAESTFGRRVANDGKFVARLRGGADLNVGTLDRVRAYIATERAKLAADKRLVRRKAAA